METAVEPGDTDLWCSCLTVLCSFANQATDVAGDPGDGEGFAVGFWFTKEVCNAEQDRCKPSDNAQLSCTSMLTAAVYVGRGSTLPSYWERDKLCRYARTC